MAGKETFDRNLLLWISRLPVSMIISRPDKAPKASDADPLHDRSPTSFSIPLKSIGPETSEGMTIDPLNVRHALPRDWAPDRSEMVVVEQMHEEGTAGFEEVVTSCADDEEVLLVVKLVACAWVDVVFVDVVEDVVKDVVENAIGVSATVMVLLFKVNMITGSVTVSPIQMYVVNTIFMYSGEDPMWREKAKGLKDMQVYSVPICVEEDRCSDNYSQPAGRGEFGLKSHTDSGDSFR